jgi:hypothetical protein
MRLRWLLTIVLALSLAPSLASARSFKRLPTTYGLGAAIDARDHSLVIAIVNAEAWPIEIPIRVHSDTTQYDWLQVEFSNATTKRAFMFIEDREHAATETVTIAANASVIERIPLAAKIAQMPPGDYDVRVIWDGHEAMTTTTVFAPYRCGLQVGPPPLPAPPSPSKLPYVLGSLALLSLLVAAAFVKRAGTPVGCVPCSLS